MSKYHTEEMVNVGTELEPKMIPRRRACRMLADTTTKDGQKVVVSSDRVYIKAEDGSIRSTKVKIPKKERRLAREAIEKAKANQIPLAGGYHVEKS